MRNALAALGFQMYNTQWEWNEIILLLKDSVASRVIQPGVVVGAPDAGVQVESLSWQFLGGHLALVGR